MPHYRNLPGQDIFHSFKTCCSFFKTDQRNLRSRILAAAGHHYGAAIIVAEVHVLPIVRDKLGKLAGFRSRAIISPGFWQLSLIICERFGATICATLLFPNREIYIFGQRTLMKPNFEIELLSEAVAFLENLDDKTREKIYYNIRKAQFITDNELLKKLTNFIWEFRTLYNNKAYRLFSFWDKVEGKDTLVVATHGILKKTQKTPLKEIEKAEEIRKQYLKNKLNKK